MLYEHDLAALTRDHGETADRAPTHAADSVAAPPPARFAESSSFGLPGWMWGLFFGSYALFFAALALATGRDGYTVFVIVISVLYTAIFFGTNAVMQALGKGKPQPFERGARMLDTWTGPMSTTTVAAQVLTIPILFAFFAIVIVIMRASLGF